MVAAQQTFQSREELAVFVENAWRLAAQQSSTSVTAYLNHVVIDSRPDPAPFRQVAKPWQWYFLSRIGNAVEALAGLRPSYQGPRAFWLTMARGHDKTSAIARLCNWVLAFSPKKIEIVAAAADREQAALLTDAMETEAGLNPWLKGRLRFVTNRVYGAGGNGKCRLRVISADAYSSFGLRADLFVCDELTHWPKRDLWDTLWSGRQKRPDSVYLVITNAGMLKTWQHDACLLAKGEPDWYVYDKPGRLPTWMNEAAIQRERRLLPPGVASRVVDNRWVDPSEGSGFVSRDEAEACERLGASLSLRQRSQGAAGTHYFVGVDYGPVRDRTALCVVHRDTEGMIVVDRMDVFQGSSERRVPVERVDELIERYQQDFHHPTFVVDPYNLESTIQKFDRQGYLLERFTPRGGKANYELAANLRNLIVNHNLAWPPGCGDIRMPDGRRHTLADEFADVTLRQTAAGFRIDNEIPGTHDDRVVALGMAALHATRHPGRKDFPDSDVFF